MALAWKMTINSKQVRNLQGDVHVAFIFTATAFALENEENEEKNQWRV
jgi:CDP-diacylglycerol pyrophosphatase